MNNPKKFAVADLPDDSIYKIVTGRHGVFLANPNDIFIGRALIRYGEFSELEWQVINQLTRPGTAVIEVGANIGAHTVSIARKVGPDGVLYAFEPQPVVFQNLCANIALNGLLNVRTMNAGCGEEGSEILFPRLDYQREGNFGAVALPDIRNAKGGDVKVPIVRLDDAYQLAALSLIKIDAEGMEAQVLRGGLRLIKRFRPVIYLENDRREKSPELITLLFELDYRVWWHLPPYFNPKNFADVEEDIYKNVVSVNMICIPKEEDASMTGFQSVSGPEDHPLSDM